MNQDSALAWQSVAPGVSLLWAVCVGVVGSAMYVLVDRFLEHESKSRTKQDQLDSLGPVKLRAEREISNWRASSFDEVMQARRTW